METINQIANRAEALPSKNSPKSSTTILKNKGTHHEISVFRGESTEQGQLEQVAKIKLAFPQLENGFYKILLDRVRDLDINDERLEASVNHVIDSCQYPQPTIAQFLSFDRQFPVYTHQQYVKKVNESGGNGLSYKSVRLRGQTRPFWAHIDDVKKYGLKPWTNGEK